MKNRNLVLPVLLLLAVTLSCTLVDRMRKRGAGSGDFSKVAGNVPSYDPNAPLPSLGGAALRGLAVLEPRVAELERSVEAAERAAMKKSLDQLSAQLSRGKSTENSSSLRLEQRPIDGRALGRSPMFGASLPLFALWQGQGALPASNLSDAISITAVVSGWNDQFTPHVEAGFGVSGGGKEKEADGATSDNTLNLGRNTDGSTSFGIGIKSEAEKNGVKAKTDVSAQLDGQRCPNAEGQVSFTMKMRLGAETGGAGYLQELTAFIRATVTDDAEVESSTMDLVQGTRQVKGDTQFYIESGMTLKFDGSNYTESNFRVIRHSQQATAENARPLSEAGLTAAQAIGETALAMAQQNWREGGCTKIEAPSPGAVAPSSTTAIPVTVRHRFDGTEVPSKLDAALSGEASVDPTTLAKTKGTLTYTAPGERGKSATIKLTATSRRGRATLDLTATTGGRAYRVAGQSNKVSFTGEICSLDKPFALDATFPGGSAKTSFTPGSALAGSTSVSGGGGGCVHSGGGNYTVTLKEDGSGTITWTTSDKITCPMFGNSRTATFTLPLQPAPDLSCP